MKTEIIVALISAGGALVAAFAGFNYGIFKDPITALIKKRRLEKFVFQIDRDLQVLTGDAVECGRRSEHVQPEELT